MSEYNDRINKYFKGVSFKSVYAESGEACVKECISHNKFKYLTEEGKPMVTEVPSDKYDEALNYLSELVSMGYVEKIIPSEIIRKGLFTFNQAKYIAKMGKIESLSYDMLSNTVYTSSQLGVSAVIYYALSVWNGSCLEEALHNALCAGLKTGGMDFAVGLFSSCEDNLNQKEIDEFLKSFEPTSETGLKENINVYGAATLTSLSYLSGSLLTGSFSVLLLSSFDIANIFNGKISPSQFFKNIANTASSVAGAAVGFKAGAVMGSVVPVVGTIVGGLFGAVVGSKVTHTVSDTVLSEFIEDDAKQMLKIIEEELVNISNIYLLNKKEINSVVDALSEKLTTEMLQEMYKSSDKRVFAGELLQRSIENELIARKAVKLPEREQIVKGLMKIFKF